LTMDEAPARLLVQRTRGGDVKAFGELVQRYQTSVFSVCYRLLGDSAEAEDLAQEAFLRAFRRLASFDVERPGGAAGPPRPAGFLPGGDRVAALPGHELR